MDNSPQLRLIRRRTKKGVLREIFLYGDIVAKRFVRICRKADSRPVWQMEDLALRRLAGCGFPHTFGYLEKPYQGTTEVLYVREFIHGRFVERLEDTEIGELAALMALIHGKGVLTCDPAPENFIHRPDGSLLFIDFGRAKVMPASGARYAYHLGKELARICHHTFFNDPGRFARFYDLYRQRLGLGGPKERLVRLVCRLWILRWTQRKRRRMQAAGCGGSSGSHDGAI